MVPGIDPKVDIAFKKVFGSPQWRNLTMALINAVLQPPPWQQLVDLELLNPYTERMSIDDKLSILDIKARDDQGRLFNLEMQMVAAASLSRRFLYYWAQLYGQQLAPGDSHDQLCPTISICFVNGRLFPGRTRYHRLFRLLDVQDQLALTGDLEIHLLELPNFGLELRALQEPLDFWLYFFKNGEVLDADALPPLLAAGDVGQAMEILKMFSQDEMERELYQGRLKARRDAQTQENVVQKTLGQLSAIQQRLTETEQLQAVAEQRRADAEQRRAEAEQRRAEAEQRRAEAEQLRAEAEQRAGVLARERDEVIRASKLARVEQIQLCQRLLGRNVTDNAELEPLGVAALQDLVRRLAGELERLP